ncbi:MAG: shikimate dehydrogenase family protein [Emergencia sp.]
MGSRNRQDSVDVSALPRWKIVFYNINTSGGETVMPVEYALIGKTLGHSWSKVIHEKIAPYDYSLVSIPEEKFDTFVSSKDYKGLNVTIPYKQKIIPYCTELSAKAAEIGSVNVVYKDVNNLLRGYNTDYYGLRYLLAKYNMQLDGLTVAILGSGGTSKTAQAAAADAGAGEILVVSRSSDINYESIKGSEEIEALINTTPVGMYPDIDAVPLCITDFPNIKYVADVVYNPYPTRLVHEAQAAGICSAGGLSMLAAQAKYTRDIFLGCGEPMVAEDIDEEVEDIVGMIEEKLK